jgi:hypothetical protein
LSVGLLDRIRAASARVMESARWVRIDDARLGALCAELLDAPPPPPALDPAHHHLGDAESTLAYVLTLDAINFGSGWFPRLAKRPGLSGYLTIATALRECFESRGPWTAAELRAMQAPLCAEVLGQDPADAEVSQLMGLFARALADLGHLLEERYAGSFAGPLLEAEGSAERLVQGLARMPFYRDVARHRGFEVPFYKRAQLTAADLSAAFGGEGYGRFHDLDDLTCFADNLVPHVLRREGVLVYAPELAKRIDAEELVAAGSEQEVEIRAGAVHAIERCVGEIARAGGSASAARIDFVLWNRGQRPEMKAHPRHRTRTTFY